MKLCVKVEGRPRVNVLPFSSSSTWSEMSNKSNPVSLLPHHVFSIIYAIGILQNLKLSQRHRCRLSSALMSHLLVAPTLLDILKDHCIHLDCEDESTKILRDSRVYSPNEIQSYPVRTENFSINKNPTRCNSVQIFIS